MHWSYTMGLFCISLMVNAVELFFFKIVSSILNHFHFYLNFITKWSLLQNPALGSPSGSSVFLLSVPHLDSLKVRSWVKGRVQLICFHISGIIVFHWLVSNILKITTWHIFSLVGGYVRQEGKPSPCFSSWLEAALWFCFLKKFLSFRLSHWAKYKNDTMSEICFNVLLMWEKCVGYRFNTIHMGW